MRGKLGAVRALKIIVPGVAIGLIGLLVAFLDPGVGAVIMLPGAFIAAIGVLFLIVVGFVTMATAGEAKRQQHSP